MIAQKKDKQRGAALVEFVLVFPILLLFLFGIIEFSVMLYDNAVITNASREAAREWIEYKDVRPTIADVGGVVTDYTSNRLITFGTGNPPTVDLQVNGVAGTVSSMAAVQGGDMLTVEVSYTYTYMLLPALVQGILPSLTLSAETVMRAE